MNRSVSLFALPLLVACSSGPDSEAGREEVAPTEPTAPGYRPDGFDFSVESIEYTLEPGEERYICTTVTLEEAKNFHRWIIGDYVGVHHMFLAESIAPEPEEEVFECPELFRPTWMPLFTTGNGHVTLDLPAETAFKVEAGTQIVMQLHLLNTTAEPLTEQVEVFAETISDQEAVSEANLYAFGTTVIDIPPRSKHDIVHECVMGRSMDAFVVFPHMHQLGTETIFETGMSKDSMEVAWQGPWDFDNQELVPADISFEKGMNVRLTCRYDNPFDHAVGYGESSLEEMCFFSVFAKDIPPLEGGCVDITNLDLSELGL